MNKVVLLAAAGAVVVAVVYRKELKAKFDNVADILAANTYLDTVSDEDHINNYTRDDAE